jgi:hypothetical protein
MIDLFNAIENRLKPLVDSREIREVRLWNNQNQASAARMTKGVVHGAIYVEFIADRVNNIGLGIKDVIYTVRFHFAIKNLKSDKVENLNFHTEFAKLIQGFSSNGVTTPVFSSFRENARENDEDHDALAFPFVDYSTIYKDYTAYFFRNAPSLPEGTLFNPQFGILERGETPEIIVPITYDPVTALVLDGNATQAGTVGQPITPITVTSILGDVKQLAIDGNDSAAFDASGLSLSAGALTGGAVAISGTLLSPASFTVVAIGLDGLTVAVAEVVITAAVAYLDVDEVVTPANIKGWWRMSDGRTDDGAAISQVNGKHLNAENLTQSTALNRPYIGGDINGVDCAIFTRRSFDFALVSDLPQPYHLFFVLEEIPAAGFQYIFGLDGVNRFFVEGDNSRFLMQVNGNISQISVTSSEWVGVFNKPFILEVHTDGAGLMTIRINGGEALEKSTGIVIQDLTFSLGWRFGGVTSSANAGFGGKIAEGIFYSSTLTTDERQDIEGILARVYSLQDNLAIGHPHKTIAP